MDVGWVKRKKPAMWAVSQVRRAPVFPLRPFLSVCYSLLEEGHIAVLTARETAWDPQGFAHTTDLWPLERFVHPPGSASALAPPYRSRPRRRQVRPHPPFLPFQFMRPRFCSCFFSRRFFFSLSFVPRRSITNMDLMQVLGDAKSLTKLTLWGSSLLSKRGLAHVLRKCPSLVDLRVGGSWFGAKEEGTPTLISRT